MERHILAILVENEPGVLNRISGLFSRRGYNIDSISVGVTERTDVSRMTITLNGDEKTLEQITKQLNKLPDVIKVSHLDQDYVERGLALIKVDISGPDARSEVMQVADVFRGAVIDVSRDTVTVEVTGTDDKIQAMMDLLREHGIKEVARTGGAAMARGPKTTSTE